MTDQIEKTVFEKICEPLKPFIVEVVESLKDDSVKYKLSLMPFAFNLIYGIISQIESIAKLTVEIKTSLVAKELGLVVASKSMYSEAFGRYNPDLFRKMFANLQQSCNFLAIPEIQSLGQILLIDGSLFPAISTMDWAKYKKGINAFKMHLSFELNRMIPVQFMCTEGNYSEKAFLQNIVEKGVTYICDRGYISFNIFKHIKEYEAFFIIRTKCNLLYDTIESSEIQIPENFMKFFDCVEDIVVVFTNDLSQIPYRIVKFTALGQSYVLTTNRFDLSTYQVIMLYAYRWQIELYFRFLKRTLKGIHLWCKEPGGIEIQFYMYMITHVLMMQFKQELQSPLNSEVEKLSDKERESEFYPVCQQDKDQNEGRFYVCGLVSLLGEKLKKTGK